MHIGYEIFKFPANDDGVYFSKPDQFFFRKVDEENKISIIEGLKSLQNVSENKKGFSETPVKEIISGKKDLSIGRSISYAKFENEYEVEHNS